MATLTETEAFARRLKSALESLGVRPSPTLVANEFNLRYWGRSVTPHTVRNWLLGQAMPTQDKLVVLAEWLQVSPEALRFGTASPRLQLSEPDGQLEQLDMADREMLNRYLSLSKAERKTVREVVAAMAQASGLRRDKSGSP